MSKIGFSNDLKTMKAEIMDAVAQQVIDMMKKTEAFEAKFKAQEDIIDEMIAKFRKETKEARQNIKKYENATDQMQVLQNDI